MHSRINKRFRVKITLMLIFFMILGIHCDLFGCQCARISYSFNRALNRNSIVVYAELVSQENDMDGYSKFKIITDYSNTIDRDTITIFSGGLDCTEFFYCKNNCKWIIILFENFEQDGEIVYSASSCIESSLQVDFEENKVKGNISRINSFSIRILFFLRIHDFPENARNFERFDKRLKRKYGTTAQHA